MKLSPLKLSTLETEFTIHRLAATAQVPESVMASQYYFIGRTEDELSIVCPSGLDSLLEPLATKQAVPGWVCIKVMGPLDFSLTGIMAELSKHLAAAEISIFAISTFDTDYLLLKRENLILGRDVLIAAGHEFVPC